MKKLDTQVLQKLKLRLEDLPPRKDLRPYDVIAELAETIADTRSRGYAIGDLVAVLAEAGITLSRNTVRNYLSRARRARAALERSASPAAMAISSATIEQASVEQSAAPAPLPDHAAQVLAHARERARALHESTVAAATPRSPGSFELVPDSDI
jgi:hypothetical protein